MAKKITKIKKNKNKDNNKNYPVRVIYDNGQSMSYSGFTPVR